VASALVDTDCVLGVIPLGALNHFARCSKIPLDLKGALDVLLSGRVVALDVGEVNGRIFLNNSVIGACPQTLIRHEITRHNGRIRKGFVAMSEFVALLRQLSRVGVRVSVDNAAFVRRIPLLFIDNNDSVTRHIVAGSRTRLIEPRGLRLYMSHHRGLVGLLRWAAKMLAGKPTTEKHVDRVTSKNILVEFRHPQVNVATDGEVKPMYTPLHYRVRPEALRLIVPAKAVSRDNVYQLMG
jgi:diacylglycerol kinase family enzyme